MYYSGTNEISTQQQTPQVCAWFFFGPFYTTFFPSWPAVHWRRSSTPTMSATMHANIAGGALAARRAVCRASRAACVPLRSRTAGLPRRAHGRFAVLAAEGETQVSL